MVNVRGLLWCAVLGTGGALSAATPRIGLSLTPGTDGFGVGVRGWMTAPFGWHAALNTSWTPGDSWGASGEGRLQMLTDGPMRWFVFGGCGGWRCAVLEGHPTDTLLLVLNAGIGVERLLGPDGRRAIGFTVGVQTGSTKYRTLERVYNRGSAEEYLAEREREYVLPTMLLRMTWSWYESGVAIPARRERRDFIWGAVTDAAARPVAGATVSVAESTTITTSRGLFRVAGVEPGVHRIVVSAEGFLPYTSTVAVRAEREGRHDVRLQRPEDPAPEPPAVGDVPGTTPAVAASSPPAAVPEPTVSPRSPGSPRPSPASPSMRAFPRAEYTGPPGSVIAVVSREILYLDIGANRGVAVGMQLAVLVPGVEPDGSGAALVGFIEVTAVHDDWAEARVIAETARPIRAGDSVRGLR